MYPYGGDVQTIDGEALRNLRAAYGWEPQHHLPTAAPTTDPALG